MADTFPTPPSPLEATLNLVRRARAILEPRECEHERDAEKHLELAEDLLILLVVQAAQEDNSAP